MKMTLKLFFKDKREIISHGDGAQKFNSISSLRQSKVVFTMLQSLQNETQWNELSGESHGHGSVRSLGCWCVVWAAEEMG